LRGHAASNHAAGADKGPSSYPYQLALRTSYDRPGADERFLLYDDLSGTVCMRDYCGPDAYGHIIMNFNILGKFVFQVNIIPNPNTRVYFHPAHSMQKRAQTMRSWSRPCE
jgi:hypothetical protein